MQYKRIDNALHNFAQSFMSGTNYFDDGHVMYEVQRLAVNHPEHEVRINFGTGLVQPDDITCSQRLRKSIAYFTQILPEHLSRHNVEPGCLGDVIVRHIVTNSGHRTWVYALDDRGKEHNVSVNPA